MCGYGGKVGRHDARRGAERMEQRDPAERDAAPAQPLAQRLQEQLQHLLATANPGTVAGIGVDLVEIADFDALPFVEHAAFYALTFTAGEIAYCQGCAAPAQHFAARFAAKEAVAKACGGLAALAPAQIEIVRTRSGAPLARLHDAPALDRLCAVHISIGHSATIAYAVALALRREEPTAVDEV
jgi:holo-[acyl-carrier protein] synthase